MIDIKLGTRSYSLHDTPAKQECPSPLCTHSLCYNIHSLLSLRYQLAKDLESTSSQHGASSLSLLPAAALS